MGAVSRRNRFLFFQRGTTTGQPHPQHRHHHKKIITPQNSQRPRNRTPATWQSHDPTHRLFPPQNIQTRCDVRRNLVHQRPVIRHLDIQAQKPQPRKRHTPDRRHQSLQTGVHPVKKVFPRIIRTQPHDPLQTRTRPHPTTTALDHREQIQRTQTGWPHPALHPSPTAQQ